MLIEHILNTLELQLPSINIVALKFWSFTIQQYNWKHHTSTQHVATRKLHLLI